MPSRALENPPLATAAEDKPSASPSPSRTSGAKSSELELAALVKRVAALEQAYLQERAPKAGEAELKEASLRRLVALEDSVVQRDDYEREQERRDADRQAVASHTHTHAHGVRVSRVDSYALSSLTRDGVRVDSPETSLKTRKEEEKKAFERKKSHTHTHTQATCRPSKRSSTQRSAYLRCRFGLSFRVVF